MTRRRLIRILLLLPLLLCIVAWLWSYRFHESLCYQYPLTPDPPRAFLAELSGGQFSLLLFEPVWAEIDSPDPVGWTHNHHALGRHDQPSDFSPSTWHGFRFLSFHVLYSPSPVSVGKADWSIQTPLWLLTPLIVFPFLLVWRKTRPNPHPQTAFPVQIEKFHD